MKRILIADDEPSTGEIIRYFIRGHSLPLEVVGEAASGDEALQAIQRLQPDLVFLDIEMPVLNGLQVMERVNAASCHDTSFIIVTAYGLFEYAQQALRLGAKDLLLKPIVYRQFCDAMNRVVGYQYSDNPLFNQILEYVGQHYHEEISLTGCAGAVSTSVNNIARLFRQHMGTNFTSYCNRLRILRAQELLSEGRPIKEVAEAVGYNNLNYFYRNFKKQVGITPREYVGKP